MNANFGGIELGQPGQAETKEAPSLLGTGGAPVANAASSRGAGAADSAGQGVNAPVVIDATDADLETLMATSTQVPVIIDLWAPWCGPCKQLGPVLEKAVQDRGGAVQLAKINVDENPMTQQAFQVQSIPAVFAIVGGRPMPLFQGAQPESVVRQVIDKLLELAASVGVTGTLSGAESPASNADQGAPAGPWAGLAGLSDPLLDQGMEAFEADDFAGAREHFESYIKKHPADETKLAPVLAQVELAQRLSSAAPDGNLTALVQAATGQPETNLDAHLAAADAQLQGGDAAGALERLLAVVAATSGDERNTARTRLVSFFNLLGTNDPLVTAARKKLATLLY